MQNSKRVSRFELFSAAASVIFVISFFVSCTKNITGAPTVQNPDQASASISANASTRTGSVAVPFENNFFVPCANGGAGETVTVTGKMNLVYQWTWTDHDFTFVYHDNYHEVNGIGLTSGETFTGSGGTDGMVMGAWVNNQWVGTMVRQVKLIGQNTVFTVRYKLDLIVTPDGNVAVNVREQTVDCQ